MDFPIQNGDVPQLCKRLPEGKSHKIPLNHHFPYGFLMVYPLFPGDLPKQLPRFIMDEGGPSVIDPQISEFRAFDARFGRATHGETTETMEGNHGKLRKHRKTVG